MSTKRKFKFVYIPADTYFVFSTTFQTFLCRSYPLEEWSEEFAAGQEVECLLDRLKQHFRQFHPKISESERKRHKDTILKKGKLEGNTKISDDLLNLATDMQLIETIALLPCMKQHDSIGVTMYVDDSGSYKNLPINTRATDLTQTCGLLTEFILGDAFLARVKENDDDFKRMDLLTSEVSSTAKWVKQAKKHNQKKMNQPMAEDIISKMKSSPKIEEITPADEERQKGNDFFKQGLFEKALECYSSCLKLDTESIPAYTNRSLMYFKLGRFEEALIDAEDALKLDNNNVKAHYRKGEALEALERHQDAICAFEEILNIQQNNKAALEKLNHLKSLPAPHSNKSGD
eukprot:g2636.t1